MAIKVKKRDYATVDYDEQKIYRAIEKAVKSAVQMDDDVPQHLVTIVKDITTKLDNIIKGYQSRGNEEIDVEHIQDLVEQQLMGAGLYEVAKAYILYREEHKQARNQRLRPDTSSIQDYMLASRYARYMKDLGRRETFPEAVGRVRDRSSGGYRNDQFCPRGSGADPHIRKLVADAGGRLRSGQGPVRRRAQLHIPRRAQKPGAVSAAETEVQPVERADVYRAHRTRTRC
jgi:hypothetical protein